MTDHQNPPNNSHDSLQTLSKQISDVTGLLRTQQEILRQRGVTLPSGSLDNLIVLKKRLDLMASQTEQGQDELRSLRALAETTALINSAQKSDEVLNQVMDKVIDLTGAERGYIVLKNKITGDLEFRVARGMDQSTLDSSAGMIVSKSIVNEVADSGEPILSDNASEDERYEDQASIVIFQLRSILAVPLKVRDEVIGVVYCDNRFLKGLFKQNELDTLTAFANQAAVAIENARLFETARTRLHEVTALRDRMMNLFTSIASGILTIDNADTILVCNPSMRDIAQIDAPLGLAMHEALPNMPDAFRETLATVRATGEQVMQECEVQINGQVRHWNLIASPLQSEETRSAHGIAMVIDDMTEQKKSEAQLVEVRRYLPEALVRNMATLDLTQIESQEREITAMFADVRGFTRFSEGLAPEELMRIINKYMTIASDAIGLFEGIVDKYLGDATTGLWNTQLNPQVDHAHRAVQAAMQLVLDLHALHEILPESECVFFGIGVHTGQAVLGNVGSVGRREFSAMGEAADVSKYLQEQAGAGEVIISQATFDCVSDIWHCERLTERARPNPAYDHLICYRVLNRKKGSSTALIDDELLALLAKEEENDNE